MKFINTKSEIKEILKKHEGDLKLNIGCGTDYKEGWVNIDNNSDENITKLDLSWDLRKPLPFPENSVDFIFNEHFFEHLTTEEAQAIIKDLMRVLKPSGIMRVAMPDLEGVVNNYLNVPLDQDPVIQSFGFGFVKTRAEWINLSFRWWGHKWLYDFEELKRRFGEAGYDKITRCKLRESNTSQLRNLEIRDGSLLIAEITK